MKMCLAQVSFLIVAVMVSMASIALAMSFSDGFGNIGLQIPIVTLLIAVSLMFGITFSCSDSEEGDSSPTHHI